MSGGVDGLTGSVDGVAQRTGFSGVVRVDRGGQVEIVRAYGAAHRGFGVPNRPDTRFGIASGTKGLTALAVMSLVAEDRLSLDTPARHVLGDDLPLIGDEVTVEHLLAHRSGIGDYLDEASGLDLADHLMPVPVHQLDTTESYLAVLEGHPATSAPGERFSYCNSGYVVLALIAQRVASTPFADLVVERVCEPAGMHDTAFLRGDEPDGRTAVGYLSAEGLRSNVLHLPVLGSGDGGLATTAADIAVFWDALFAGRIVPSDVLAEMVRPRSDASPHRYGLGFWLKADADVVFLEGADAGVSFRSTHDPGRQVTCSVFSNTTDGAWPLVRHLDGALGWS